MLHFVLFFSYSNMIVCCYNLLEGEIISIGHDLIKQICLITQDTYRYSELQPIKNQRYVYFFYKSINYYIQYLTVLI